MAKNKDITYNQLSTIKPVTDSQKIVFELGKNLEDNVIVSAQCEMINGENGDWSYTARGRAEEKQLGLMV